MVSTLKHERRTDRTGQQNGGVPPTAVPDPALAAVMRRLRGTTPQQTVASRAGLTTGTYAKVELGKSNPTWTTVCAIAGALGVSLRELVEAIEAEK
jgi:transcriptional regulator with XRE-family HTH domain